MADDGDVKRYQCNDDSCCGNLAVRDSTVGCFNFY